MLEPPLPPPTWHDWIPVSAAPDKRWLAVKDRLCGVRQRCAAPIIVNTDRWVNGAVRYQADRGDAWAAPATTLARGYGDCEDLALLKRAVLINSGIPERRIYFVLVADLIARMDHAVIVAFEDRWRLMDSYNSQALPLEAAKDYRPILAMCSDCAWTFGKRRKVGA
jgi:transglutaminase-like putative cysteine protease